MCGARDAAAPIGCSHEVDDEVVDLILMRERARVPQKVNAFRNKQAFLVEEKTVALSFDSQRKQPRETHLGMDGSW